jgi:hypothetical protein
MIARIAQRCSRRTTQVQRQAHSLQQEITKVMRGFGRQCRGHGHVLVKLVRHTGFVKLLRLRRSSGKRVPLPDPTHP